MLFLSSKSSYSQLLAATCLSKLVSRTSNPLPLEQRIDIREYFSFPAQLLQNCSLKIIYIKFVSLVL